MSLTVEMLPIAKIGTDGRKRKADVAWVEALSASIGRAAKVGVGYDGLRTPVEVRKTGKTYRLIAGLHRFHAVRRLQRTEIAAVVLDVDEIEAELLELEENLVRHDLVALDRAFFVLRFREMFEAAYGVVSAGRPKSENTKNADEKNSGNLPPFSFHAVDRLGLSEDSIKRCLRIAKGLTEDSVESLRSTKWANNQSALLELGSVPVGRQADVIALLLDEENGITSVRDAIAHLEGVAKPDKEEAVFRKWLGVSSLKKPLKRRILKEWMGSDPDLFAEVAREMGVRITSDEEV